MPVLAGLREGERVVTAGPLGPHDLLRVAEGACGCQLDQLYNDWVLTSKQVPIP